jgi:hypothetical protein
MKSKKLIPIAFVLTTLAPLAQANVQMKVVPNYDLASDPSFWAKPKNDQIPQGLMQDTVVVDPSQPYANLYPNSFLQQPQFVVCYVDCKKGDQFKLNSGDVKTLERGSMSDWDLVEQNNVYFWVTKYMNHLVTDYNFAPKWYLQVYSNRIVKEGGDVLRNNAFYNPKDNTLSFLPATNGFLYKLLNGKINRSGFDPSVILHETSHFLFEHLFANPMNKEITGLNEGFADYMANSFLNNPKVGMIMLQGKALRDSSSFTSSDNKLKTYAPRLEAHDLGERAATALWKSRQLADDKLAFDRMVIEGVKELSQNVYSTAHDFKQIMINRIKYEFSSQNAAVAIATWEAIFPGEVSKVASLAFMDQPRTNLNIMGFKMSEIIPLKMQLEMGVEEKDLQTNFVILKNQEIAHGQRAILITSEDDTLATPYWIVLDSVRLNILGIYGIDKKLVTSSEEATKVTEVAQQVLAASDLMNDFAKKVKTFAQLANGQGELTSGYKVTGTALTPEEVEMNGQKVMGQKLEITLKKKFFVGLFFGLPEITKVVLLSAPNNAKGLAKMPKLNDQPIVGYRLLLKSGIGQEVMLNKYEDGQP